MGATSKSPRRVFAVGYLIDKLALPDYSKTYTQPQLFACLVLKEFLHRDYRGIEALLTDSPDLAAVAELESIADHSTLQKAAARLLRVGAAERLLDMTLRLAKLLRLLPPIRGISSLLAMRHASIEPANRFSH